MLLAAKNPLILGRSGRALCRGRRTAGGAGRARSRRRSSPPIPARARSRTAIRWRSARRPARGRRCSPTSWRRPIWSWRSARASPARLSAPACRRARPSSIPPTKPSDINKEYRADHAVIGDAALVLDALIAEVGAAEGRRRRQCAHVAEGRDRGRQEGLARRMGQAFRFRRDADQPVSRDPRPDAHRRPRQRHHDPRLRQPARADDAVLGDHRGRLLHGLGQVDPARLWARHHHGRQARRAEQALHQRHGRRRHRHDRHGYRNRGAQQDRASSRSCSTTA